MKIFLDDYRKPEDCLKYMFDKIGAYASLYKRDWFIVRNYPEFKKLVESYAVDKSTWSKIEIISFDHDLADGHYHKSMQKGKINYGMDSFKDDYNKTGYHCAELVVEICMDRGYHVPDYIVHSMNPVGAENIRGLLDNYKLHG